MIVNLPPLAKRGFLPAPAWQPGHPAVKKIVGMMIPAAYGAAVYQFNVIVVTLLASFLPDGSVSYLWYADRVMEFPLGIFAVSLATVILPTLSEHAADGDLKALKESFGFALRLVFFVTVPAAAGLMILSEDIIRVLFQHGSFGPDSTALTASALIFFAAGLPFISGVRVTSNAFYALQDAKTPVRLANWSMAANIALSLALMRPLGHLGLALALSLSALVNFALQAAFFRRKTGRLGLRKILLGTIRTVLASAAMVAAVWAFRFHVPVLDGRPERWAAAAVLSIHIAVGVAAYTAAGWCLRMEEFKELLGALRKRGRVRTPPPTDLSGDGGI
jgi:putative peptidoglycan lipid II flippase